MSLRRALVATVLIVLVGAAAVTLISRDSESDRAGTVVVPDLRGTDRDSAAGLLSRARLRATFRGGSRGVVARQRPPAGSEVARGSGVTVELQ
jgi:beta-lactam-binding protein with PASTA domain